MLPVSQKQQSADIPDFKVLEKDSAKGNLVNIEDQVQYTNVFFSLCLFSFVLL